MLKITPCSSDIRLDRYIKRLYPYITQGIIEKSLRNKKILVNGHKAKSNVRLSATDHLEIDESLIQNNYKEANKIFSSGAITLASKLLKEYLIFDNEQFIAINKPLKLCAQGGSKISLSIDDALNYLNSQNHDFKLVHRIDKDTSGILLIAKDQACASILAQAFKDKLIQKTYLAIVEGELRNSEGVIQNFISKDLHQAYQKVVVNQESGKLAITYYKLLKSLKDNLLLVEFRPITGRMHQIRVHASSIGCPILGDRKYGPTGQKNSNMFLHAHKVTMPSSLFNKEISIEAPIPDYFLKLIN